mmetsp:Transcript_70218/g.158771  ORF Transcript_70218/g.158771 Transcript_70218/m.158771 type:complete len:192 (-) Transcript_70218:43-618(-)
MYGHVKTMALSVKEGLEEKGCTVDLLQVPETLPSEVLEAMHAPPKDPEVPIATATTLPDYDGIIFGLPTRFGMAPAQMKSFMDSTGQLWMTGALIGKPAGCFFSTGTQGGGQETTALTWVTQLTHHGMVYVPMGCANPLLMNMEEIHGGSPWGPGCYAGPDGSRQPSKLEKDLAKHYGGHFAGIAIKLSSA